jgi:hypothetical protein
MAALPSFAPLVFISGSSGLLKRVKGWRRFARSRTLGRHFRPTQRPRSLDAKKGTSAPTDQKLEDPEKDRPIDPTSGKNAAA